MKLNTKKIIYVGFAFLLIQTFWQAYDNLIAKILIDKFGLNQTWSGFVMAFDNILALFMLPLFGLLSDKTTTKIGKRTPYIIIGTLIASLAFVGIGLIDKKQTEFVHNETSVVAEYEKIKDHEDVVADWEAVVAEMNGDIINESSSDKSSYKEQINEILTEYTAQNKEKLDLAEVYEVKDLYSNYLSAQVREKTHKDPKMFIVFMLVLLVSLIAMSIYRSPAVALMPDVVVKPLRSKANAIINLMGAVGGVLFLVLSMAIGIDKYSYLNYFWGFAAVAIIMIASLIVFLFNVNEVELVTLRKQEEEEYGLLELEKEEEEVIGKETLSRDKKASLLLILFSVLFWFMGYNAIISKLSDYAPKMLNMGFSLTLLIANATAIIGFIPIGILSSKLGRKKVIIFGIILLVLCFSFVPLLSQKTNYLMYLILGLTGIAWASINVNSYPMVVELSTGSNVGKYTGYYYAFSMAAQIITPILSGLLMDKIGRIVLFPYAAVMVVISLITFLFVKHGDVKPEAKESLLEHFDVED
ncbi:MAG: MFS transporter [Acholeplasmataceae bacterium]|nr:MFS transporter [Acholeplasmataceae bacterium]MCK9427203.1 MFS transporter [Acholeplasmataceae bacterium]